MIDILLTCIVCITIGLSVNTICDAVKYVAGLKYVKIPHEDTV